MGREAYLARVVLVKLTFFCDSQKPDTHLQGRSAFEEPLRNENGDFVLGGQARAFDDKSYVQQWDERGHPRNIESERRAKRLRKAQNEVLAACGVIVKKDEDRKKRERREETPEDSQLVVLDDENWVGLMLRCVDRFSGNILTWWINSLRRRSIVSGLLTSAQILRVDA